MAMGKPVVSFNLKEQRFTAQEAAVYVENNDVQAYGDAILRLLDDAEKRRAMGAFGQQRARAALSWDHGRANLLAAYAALFGRGRAAGAAAQPARPS
jgi:glycosyltransferase involved in cell wall biosynthesis